jgi:hypothetical protein
VFLELGAQKPCQCLDRKTLVARILGGEGRASHAQRHAAFDNTGLAEPLRTLIDKVAKHAYKVTDDDIALDSHRNQYAFRIGRVTRNE